MLLTIISNNMKACVLSGIGKASNLTIKNIESPTNVGANDVMISQKSITINFDDILYRNGTFEIPDSIAKVKPLILGLDGVGEVVKKGENVRGFQVGDQVGYAFCPLGGYTQTRVIDYRYLLNIPKEISSDIAAAILRRGLTAEYLLFKAFAPRKDEWILVHSVAGGVGHLIAKWAKFSGLNVIGTIRDESKLSIGLATGANFVINRQKENVYEKVIEYTENKGVRAVFDGIGKAVFETSMLSLQPFGIYISYGYAGGLLDKIDVMDLRRKNLFFTAPTINQYKGDRRELILTAANVFDMVKKGVLVPNITRYAFEGIPQAHVDLESGKTIGIPVISVY